MFIHELMSYETDLYGNMPPSLMLRLCMYATGQQSDTEGVTAAWLREKLGAVWMLARMRCEQYVPLRAGALLELESSPRAIQGAGYIRQVRVWCSGKEVASCLLVWTMVHYEKRHIVRPAELEALWDRSYPPVELPNVPRLRVPHDLPETGSTLARWSDCDVNGHLSSSNYADIVCDEFGFWTNGPKLMRSLQLDFHAEFRPGAALRLFGGETPAGLMVCGRHTDGGPGFAALADIVDLVELPD